MIGKVKKEIKTAFENINKTNGIELHKIIVQITLNDKNSLKYHIRTLPDFQVISETSLAKLIGSTNAMLIQFKLKEKVQKIINGREEKNVLLVLKNGEPSAFICKDNFKGFSMQLEELFT